MKGVEILFSGQVQGVGFRYTCLSISGSYSVAGYVMNLSNGQVKLVAEGEGGELDRFLTEINQTMRENISGFEQSPVSPQGFDAFTIKRV